MENGKRMKRRSHRQNNFKAVVYYKTTWLEHTLTHTRTYTTHNTHNAHTKMKQRPRRAGHRVCVCDGQRAVWMDTRIHVCVCTCMHTLYIHSYIHIYICIDSVHVSVSVNALCVNIGHRKRQRTGCSRWEPLQAHAQQKIRQINI